MKQIILTILLLSNIVAQTTQHDICLFKKVIKNGWNDNNQTLNQKIIDLEKSEIPRILKHLNYPLSPDENTSEIVHIPKFKLTRDDYILLMSYTKYLEAQNKVDKSNQIYIQAFGGISNIKSPTMLATIYRLAMNNLMKESLNQSLSNKKFTIKNKQFLYNHLSKLLILDDSAIIAAIISERDINNQLIHKIKSNENNEKYLKIYQQEFNKINNNFWGTHIKAIKTNSINETEKREETRLKSLSFWNTIKLFLLNTKMSLYRKLSISIDKTDHIAHAKYSAMYTLLVATPKLYETCQDYLNMIDENKKLLKRLKGD